jgi:uncharacterized lipoprotein YmbA
VEFDTDQAAERPQGSKVNRNLLTKSLGFAGVCILALLMVECGGKIRYPKYYTLSIAPTATPALEDPLRTATLAVRRFETSAYLRQGRIVYREAPNEIGFYEYHRWASDPGATVTSGVIDALRLSKLFSSVEFYDGHNKAEYLLTGRLERLDEIDYGGGVRVEAKLTVQITNLRTGATLWSGSAAQSLGVDSRTVSAIVSRMSDAVQASITSLVASMEQQLSDAHISELNRNVH